MIFNTKNYLKTGKSITWFTHLMSVINILHSFIPHEVITRYDRKPPWINN